MAGSAAAVTLFGEVKRFAFHPVFKETENTLALLRRDEGLKQRRVGRIVEADEGEFNVQPFLEAIRVGLSFFCHIQNIAFLCAFGKLSREIKILTYKI